MGDDLLQWRAAIGRFAFRRALSGSNGRDVLIRSRAHYNYPYRPPTTEDPADIQKALYKHFHFLCVAAVILPCDLRQRNELFNSLVSRLLLIAAGIESNPGPAPGNSSTKNSNAKSGHQSKRLKTLDSFLKPSSLSTDRPLVQTSTPTGTAEAASVPVDVAVTAAPTPTAEEAATTATAICSTSSIALSTVTTNTSPAPANEEIVNQQRLAKLQENRERLTPIVRATLFLGRQGLAFRGHRDDGKLLSNSASGSSATANEGNFREVLRLMVEAGDKKLEEHLKNAHSNATYISKTTQNELIEVIGEKILEKIMSRVREALFYSILFDETTDSSHKSRLSVILRYVTKDDIYEDFISFVDAFADHEGALCDDEGTYQSDEDESEMDDAGAARSEINKETEIRMTGKNIGQIVLRVLKTLGLSLDKCVGIGTDGCSVMTSEVRGAVLEIQKEAKNALQTPCFNHKLNLSISQSNKIVYIRNSVGTMKECVKFFDASAKRSRTLQKYVGHALSGLCETRWVKRHDGVLQFSVDLPKIQLALESISKWEDASTASKASQLKAALSDSFFLVSVMCLSDILALTLPLSKLFQKPTLNLDTGAETITNLISVLSTRRGNAEEHFKSIWTDIEGLAEKVDTNLILPRRCGRQGNRANYPTESPEAYFRQAIYIPLLDNILMDIKERFPPEVVDCFQLPLLLPSHITKLTASDLTQKTEILVKNFSALLPFETDMSRKLLDGELTMWQEKWKAIASSEHPQSSLDALRSSDLDVYPVIHTLLYVLTTLPVSNATAERSFSALRRLKSWLRSPMSQIRLTGLALMHVHRHVDLDIDDIITSFAKSRKRRIDFIL
ncbi:52 kDa repressor of the inhibitor of the protein kinase [Frankliniella fusca]|uniref:52 kDa repressor of the inhibitor of the protein kinase n=1 Tax=Frankliniella fusca TaxID=407009 RepID=A0AAE1L7F8_9NEOP|nr:52 kDa repressor of the inhibitor of the protein kinase [Frankliniella fusca]